jgi:hypothetical protein
MGDIVHGDKVNGNVVNGDYVGRDKVILDIGPDHAPRRDGRPPEDSDGRAVVLMMSANPDVDASLDLDASPRMDASLRLDEERRQIDLAIVRAEAQHRLAFRIADAVRLGDLPSSLLRHRPAIVHFAGHGTAMDGLLVTDDAGNARPVPPDALADLFGLLNSGLRCVVLNACYSAEQARSIVRHVPFVVGMRHWVDDDAAIRFATGFYEGIAHGESVRVSFGLGRTSLRLHGYSGAAPVLLAADGATDEPIAPRK